MALDKDKVQGYLDDFVIKNEDDINMVATENPVLYNAIMDFVEVFSKKFGTAKTPEVIARPTPKAEEVIETKEEVVAEEQLPYKLGDYFYHYDNRSDHYKIVGVDNDYVEVQLPNSSQTTFYEKNIVKDYFDSGTWINIGYPYLERKPKFVKNIMKLYEVKSLSTPDKKVLTNEDGSKIYEYIDDVLYDTDPMTGKRTTSYRMSRTIVSILPPKEAPQEATEAAPEVINSVDEEIKKLKEVIEGLELIADFDTEAVDELKSLKKRLKELKKKKS